MHFQTGIIHTNGCIIEQKQNQNEYQNKVRLGLFIS